MTPYDLRSAVDFTLMGLSVGLFSLFLQGLARMRQHFLALLFLLGLTVPLVAQTQYVTLADVTVTGTAASVFSSSDVLAGNGHPAAQSASCTLTAANIRVTFDGTTPTTNLGQVVAVGGPYVIGPTVNLLNMQAIRDDSTSGVLSCTLVRQ